LFVIIKKNKGEKIKMNHNQIEQLIERTKQHTNEFTVISLPVKVTQSRKKNKELVGILEDYSKMLEIEVGGNISVGLWRSTITQIDILGHVSPVRLFLVMLDGLLPAGSIVTTNIVGE
jgi:hypothetical protein